MKILFVCDSNLRRSQMAEIIGQVKYPEHQYRSAGFTSFGFNTKPNCCEQIKEQLGEKYYQVAIDKHSKELNERYIDWADLIFTMTEIQSDKIKRDYPESENKTYTLKEWNGESKFGFDWDVYTDISPKDMMELIDKAINKINKLTSRPIKSEPQDDTN